MKHGPPTVAEPAHARLMACEKEVYQNRIHVNFIVRFN